jgi:hypothetical protein
MLFFVENDFVEVFFERTYPGVLTFCSNEPDLLTTLAQKTGTMGEPIELHNQNHKWALHVPADTTNDLVSLVNFKDIETIDRITPPPLAYAYDYVLTSALEEQEAKGGPLFGDYGYCWPEEIEKTRDRMLNCEDPVYGELYFIPIWTLPNELTGAPREPIIIDDEDLDD